MALTQITEKGIKDGELVNADINASAAIAGSKLAASTTSVAGSMSAADKTKLDGIEASATADQTNAEIRSAVEAASDSNVFTDADHTKLNGIAASANNYTHPNHSGDVTSSADGATTIADNAVTLAKMAGGTDGQIITYDASGDPIAVGPGTDGQVLTSTGAGSPPAFEAIPAAGAALTGSTDNTITTVTGANAIQGEANLTFDGTTLKVGGDSGESGTWHLETHNGSGDGNAIISGSTGAKLQLSDTGSSEKFVLAANGDCNVYSYKNGDKIGFHTTDGSGTTERLKIHSSGDVEVKTGTLIIGTAGEGIDFSATSDVAGKTNERLEDYEEGTFTPAINNAYSSITYSSQNGLYVKIGRMVHCSLIIAVTAATAEGPGIRITGLPFTTHANNYSSGGITYCDLFSGFEKADPYVSGNTTEIRFYQKGSATQITTSGTSNITSEKYLGVGITYQV